MHTSPSADSRDAGLDSEFRRGLGLYDATMVVVGSMIGSGIFIVSADMARLIGSPGWLLLAWVLTGVLTVGAALAYGELAAMMPRAGGQYVFLREAFSPLWGFLYGWTLFTVIQTGTIAAVAVAFARFTGVLFPAIAEDQYLIAPIHITSGYALSLSTAQLVGVLLIALLTWSNTRGLEYGKIVQNVFTTAKTGALIALIAAGLLLGWNADAVSANFGNLWQPRGFVELAPGLTAVSAFGLFVAIGIAQTGSLFSSDAWNNICFTAGEVKDPRRTLPLAMVLGTAIVTGLYVLSNVAYLVALPLESDPVGAVGPRRHAPAQHRVPRRWRSGHGGGDHGVHVRLRERAGPRRSARLLRDGSRRAVLPSRRRVERGKGAGVRPGVAGALGRRARAAAHVRRHDRPLRQSLLEPARLRHLGGADFLCAHGGRAVPAARDPPGCATSLQGVRLPGDSRPSTSSAPSRSCSCSSRIGRRRHGLVSRSCLPGCRSI